MQETDASTFHNTYIWYISIYGILAIWRAVPSLGTSAARTAPTSDSEPGDKRRSDRAYLRLMVAYVFYLEFGLFLLVSHHDDAKPRDSHKPGIYGSGREWANAWDVFRRTPSRGGRGRRAAVDFVMCFG